MKAVWFEKFGAARDVLIVGEHVDPEPGADQVLVRLATSGVNPSDVKKRAGAFPNLLDDGLVIPHSDGAGVIEAVGKNVRDRQPGDRVWVYQAQFSRRLGTAAELLAIDASRTALLPANTDYAIGACLGIPAMTAHRCVFSDGAVDGRTILVSGGAGRVGHYAIQWAALAGASVYATASNDDDVRSCMDAGATGVVNHRDRDWAQAALDASGGRKFDRVIDVQFGANLPQVLQLVSTGGKIVSYSSTIVSEPVLPFLKMMYLDLSVQLVIVYAMPESAKKHAIRDIETYLHEGKLKHRIAAQFSLEDTAAAHEMVEAGECRGCVIVDIE